MAIRSVQSGTGRVRSPGRPAGSSGSGGGGGGSFGTFDPTNIGLNVALSGGNLVATMSAAAQGATSVKGQTVYTSGDKYFEVTVSSSAVEVLIGLALTGVANSAGNPGASSSAWGYYGSVGRGYHSGGFTFTGATYGVGSVIGVRFDGTTITFYKNGVSQGTETPGTTALKPQVGNALGNTPQVVFTANFGATAFAFQPGGTTAWG